MINAIDLKTGKNNEYFNNLGGSLIILSNLKHINVFVGENNSGKSRFMRSLFLNNSAETLYDSPNSIKEFNNISSSIKHSFNRLNLINSQYSISTNHESLSPCELYSFYKNQYDYYDIRNANIPYPNQGLTNDVTRELDLLHDMLIKKKDGYTVLLKSIPKVYIPVLRGVECFNLYYDINNKNPLDSLGMNKEQRNALEEYKNNSERIYKNKIRKVYGIPSELIFTGEDLYKDIRNKLLGEADERQLVKEFEDFISKNFYDSKGFTIIPNINKGFLYVKLGDGSERPLHNLGDGIKQLICILYKAFELRHEETLICIEEPEINLHPGYQRKLIEILQKEEFSNLQFMITTHSNHIVDSCFDYNNISIYKFLNVGKSNNRFQVINTTPNDIDILNQLGVNNSSVFMSNCTIWVEGLSDKVYLSKYLKTYIESDTQFIRFKEGVDYSFVEYGGNNIVHWGFTDVDSDDDKIKASGITNRAFIIVDNDNDRSNKRKRKEHLEALFGNRYLELSVREIENTIGNKLLEKTLFAGEPVYNKGVITTDSIENKSTIVWEYIDSHYDTGKKYYSGNRNLPNVPKLAFAKQVCSKIESIDDLSTTAKKVAKIIYDFIYNVNQEIN